MLRPALWKVLGGCAGVLLRPAGGGACLSVLIYHAVGPRPAPLGHWDTDVASFDSQMTVVKNAFRVLPLAEAVRRLRAGTLPPSAASITFDDGYADNATVAVPILERHGLPATFFIATAYLDGGRMFNDAIIEAVRRCPHERVDLGALGLGVVELGSLEQRARAVTTLLRHVKYLPLGIREETTEAIVSACGVTLEERLMMTRPQVESLVRAGMEVGGHTHRHPILTSLPDADAEAEIRVGKTALEEIVGRPVTLFAYPNGQPGKDYAPRHVAMVREAGFEAAVSTAHGVACRTASVFELPRFTPWDRSPERFLGRLLLNTRHRRPRIAA